MTVADSNALPAGRHRPARASRPGRGVRDRPGRLLAAVRGPQGARSRATSAASRSASRSSAARSSPRGSWTRRRAPARRATASRAAQVDLVLCHAVTYATSSRCCPAAQAGEGAGRPARPAADRDARLRRHRHGRVAGQLRRLLRAGDRRAPSPARGSPTTPSAGTIDDDERAWAQDRRAGSARPASRARSGARGSASSGTPIRGCSTCTPTSPRCTRSSARTSRCSRSTTSARAWRRRPTTEVAAKLDGDPRDVRVRRPVGGPDRRPDRARAARLVGARRGRPGPARRRLRARRADLLLPRASTATRPSGSARA